MLGGDTAHYRADVAPHEIRNSGGNDPLSGYLVVSYR
jgi:hypothetical protein